MVSVTGDDDENGPRLVVPSIGNSLGCGLPDDACDRSVCDFCRPELVDTAHEVQCAAKPCRWPNCRETDATCGISFPPQNGLDGACWHLAPLLAFPFAWAAGDSDSPAHTTYRRLLWREFQRWQNICPDPWGFPHSVLPRELRALPGRLGNVRHASA